MNITRYPNLREIMKYHSYSELTVCDWANIEPELLHAALNRYELLNSDEIALIATLYRCPVGVIQYGKLIKFDMNRRKHSIMAAEVDSLYMRLKYMAKLEKNEDAVRYLEFCDREMQEYMRAVHINQLSYGHWLGMRHQAMNYVLFATPPLKKRGLSTQCQ